MNKWLVCLVAVIVCPGFIALSAAQEEVHTIEGCAP